MAGTSANFQVLLSSGHVGIFTAQQNSFTDILMKVFGECGHFEHVVWPDSYLQCIAKLLGM